jgi:hypothetical protein
VGPHHDIHLREWDVRDRAQCTGGMGAVIRNDTTPVIPATAGVHASTATGATTTVLPNLSLREFGSTPRPSSMVQSKMRPHGHNTYQQLMEKPGLDGHGVLVL